MKFDQTLRELRGIPGLTPGRRPTAADVALGGFYSKLRRVNPADPRVRAYAPTAGRAEVPPWRGGEAWLQRLATARSCFDLEEELRDAERFGGFLNRKTRERGARIARVRLAELQGEVLGAEEA